MENDRLLLRQFLAGRDFARSNPLAAQMLNFSYLIADREAGEGFLVDPAWAPDELLELVRAEGLRLSGILATHDHPDHIGGDLLGMAQVPGVRELLALAPVPVHCHTSDRQRITERTGIEPEVLVGHEDGDEIRLGSLTIEVLHTPGHTPGGVCYLVAGNLLSGDTLFLEGCGRTDFPGGSAADLYRSLHERLAPLPDETILYSGHRYSPGDHAPLGKVRAENYVFQVASLEEWLRLMP